MIKVSVRPAPGIKVRTEDGRRHIAEKGEAVAATNYIARRLRAGDLVLTDDESAAAPAARPSAETEPDAQQEAVRRPRRRASNKEA